MTFPRLQSLSACWQEHPPLRLQVAGIFQALLGVGGLPAMAESQENGSLNEFVDCFTGMGGAIG